MPYQYTQNPITGEVELVVSGWENGIADSPHFGIADMRNINNDSQPGVALCNYKLVQISQTPITNVTFTASTGDSSISWTGTKMISGSAGGLGVAIKFTGSSLPSGITAGTIYYAVADGTGLKATLYTTFDQFNGTATQITLSTTGSGAMTFSTVNMGAWNPQNYAKDIRTGWFYLLDNSGQVWVIGGAGSNTPTLITGNTLTNANGNGIAIYKNNLFIFRNHLIDVYGDLSGSSFSWTNSWQTLNTASGTNNRHYAKVGQDDILYYCDANYIGSVQQVDINSYAIGWSAPLALGVTSGTLSTINGQAFVSFPYTTGSYLTTFSSGETRIATFTKTSANVTWTGALTLNAGVNATMAFSNQTTLAPGDATTYIFTLIALTLPINETANYLEELYGTTTLLIGTLSSDRLYPWDRTSTTYNLPIQLNEIGTYGMISLNKLVYILNGKRGNIYYTNGSSLIHFASVPKYPAKTPYPTYYWGGIMSLNNNVCFGVSDKGSGILSSAGGCWAVTLALSPIQNSISGAIRYKNQPSPGFYNTDILIPDPDGLRFYAASYNGTNGVIDYLDTTTPTFYSNYESYIETDIIPVGTSLEPKTFNIVEAKLDTETTAGEKFRVSMRSDLTPSYTQAFEVTATGSIDGNSSAVGIPIQLGKWIQFKIELQTSGSSNSFTRLKEIRLR